MARTDVHSPKSFEIVDYEVVDQFGVVTFESGDGYDSETYGDEAAGLYLDGDRRGNPHPSLNQCDLCGTQFVHGVVLIHTPTGDVISIGGHCMTAIAGLRGLTDGQKLHAAKVAKTRRERVINMRLLLADAPGINRALHSSHRICQDLRAQVLSRGRLSDKQIALAFKCAADQIEREAAEPDWAPVPVSDKRLRVTATILGTKEVPGFGFDQTVTKAILHCERDGAQFKLWGSVPSALVEACWVERNAVKDAIDATVGQESHATQRARYGRRQALQAEYERTYRAELKGTRFSFDSRIEPSPRDPLFGFYKRPTKIEIHTLGQVAPPPPPVQGCAEPVQIDDAPWLSEHIERFDLTSIPGHEFAFALERLQAGDERADVLKRLKLRECELAS